MTQFEIDITFKIRYAVTKVDRAFYEGAETLREMLEADLIAANDHPLDFINILDKHVVGVDVVGRIIENGEVGTGVRYDYRSNES